MWDSWQYFVCLFVGSIWFFVDSFGNSRWDLLTQTQKTWMSRWAVWVRCPRTGFAICLLQDLQDLQVPPRPQLPLSLPPDLFYPFSLGWMLRQESQGVTRAPIGQPQPPQGPPSRHSESKDRLAFQPFTSLWLHFGWQVRLRVHRNFLSRCSQRWAFCNVLPTPQSFGTPVSGESMSLTRKKYTDLNVHSMLNLNEHSTGSLC